MHILRWLLVRPVVLVAVLALITILLNWIVAGQQPEQEGYSADGEQKTEYVAVDDTDKATQLKANDAADDKSDADAPAVAEESESGQASKQGLLANVDDADSMGTSAGAAVAATTTEQSNASNEAQAITQETDNTGEAMAVQVKSKADASEDPQQAQSEQSAEQSAEQTATQVKVAKEEAGEGSSKADLLRAAREAYWSEEFDRSVDFYNSLLEVDAQPAYKGELANVYWKQGKNQQAVDLYAEIASWMAEQGRTEELISIKVYADLVDPDKAAEIGQYLD